MIARQKDTVLAGLAVLAVLSSGLLTGSLEAQPASNHSPLAAPIKKPERYDWRYADSLRRFTERIQGSMVRLERLAEKVSPLEVDRLIDGVGVVVGPNLVVTTGEWLKGAETIWSVQNDERLGEAKVVARGKDPDLLLLSLEVPKGVILKPVEGFTSLIEDVPTEVILPMVVGRRTSGVNRGAAIRDKTGFYVGGALRNGVPAFDDSARVIALCLGPTPDQTRSLAVSGFEVEAFLETHGVSFKKTDPAP